MEQRLRSNVKRRCNDALETLETLAGTGDVNENALVQLAKKLKMVHDADGMRELKIQRDVVVEYAIIEPATIGFAPDSVETFNIRFVNLLMRRKRESMEIDKERHLKLAGEELKNAVELHDTRMTNWLSRVVEFYVGDGSCESSVRMGIEMLLEVDSKLFEAPLLRHLQRDVIVDADELYEDHQVELHWMLELAPSLSEWAFPTADNDDNETTNGPKA